MQSDSQINDVIVKVIQQQHLEIDPDMLTDSIDASTTGCPQHHTKAAWIKFLAPALAGVKQQN